MRVDRRKISLEEPLKRVGRYEVPIDLFQDVRVDVKTLVVPEGGELPEEEEPPAAEEEPPAAEEEPPAAEEEPPAAEDEPAASDEPAEDEPAATDDEEPLAAEADAPAEDGRS
jgi:hypothetical protein